VGLRDPLVELAEQVLEPAQAPLSAQGAAVV
jgi:hypothetical protein